MDFDSFSWHKVFPFLQSHQYALIPRGLLEEEFTESSPAEND